RRLRVDRERELAAQVDPPFERGLGSIDRLEAAALALLPQQRLEHVLDLIGPAENPFQLRPPAAGPDDRQVPRTGVAAALLVDQNGHAGREIGLADKELPPSGNFDYEGLRPGGNGGS